MNHAAIIRDLDDTPVPGFNAPEVTRTFADLTPAQTEEWCRLSLIRDKLDALTNEMVDHPAITTSPAFTIGKLAIELMTDETDARMRAIIAE